MDEPETSPPSAAEVLDARIGEVVQTEMENMRQDLQAWSERMTRYVDDQVTYMAGMVAGAKISVEKPQPKVKPKPSDD